MLHERPAGIRDYGDPLRFCLPTTGRQGCLRSQTCAATSWEVVGQFAIPAHGSGWMFQVQPTEESHISKFPQRKLGDSKPSLLPHKTHEVWLKRSVRLDLNYPPTPVGGIGKFDKDAACRLDLKASTHSRGVGFQTDPLPFPPIAQPTNNYYLSILTGTDSLFFFYCGCPLFYIRAPLLTRLNRGLADRH